MRRYLADTTILTAYLYHRRPALNLLNPWIGRKEASTSIPVYGEMVEHLRGRADYLRHRDELRHLLKEVTPYFLTYNTMDRYAALRRELRPPRGPGLIGDVDTLIAATALERGLTAVTTDADFERIPDLKLMLIPRRSLEAR
ncbi:MAG: type II toxin-antitoxin system VapC family toxin [Chloroflexi bacterium]|nr:type II toxin-antitoxin system VapC family toxin [Chloroflexota bacterium]